MVSGTPLLTTKLPGMPMEYWEYVYLFDNEKLEDLLRLNMHCLYYKKCRFVDLNLTNYDIDCIKKADIKDKDYDKIEKKDFKIGIIIIMTIQ